MRDKVNTLSLVLIGAALPLNVYSKGIMISILTLGAFLGLSSLSLQNIKESILKIKSSTIVKISILAFSSFLVSVFFSLNFEYSVKKITGLFLACLLTFFIYIVLDNTSKEKHFIVIKSMLVCFFIDIAYLLCEIFIIPQDILVKLYKENAVPSRVRYPANQLAVLFPLVFGSLYLNRNKKRIYKAVLYFLIPLTLVFFFITGGRSALVSYIFSIIVIFGLLLISKDIKINYKSVIISIIILVSSFGIGSQIYQKHYGSDTFYYRYSFKSKDITAGRFDIWRFTYNETIKRPILGLGIGTYKSIAENAVKNGVKLKATNHPHNFIMEIFASAGILGLLSMFILCTYISFDLLKKIKHNKFGVFAFASFVTYWVNSLTSVSVIQFYWILFFTIPLVIGYYYTKTTSDYNNI